jgi:hypothetical protein
MTELVERNGLSDNGLAPLALLSDKLKLRLISALQEYADEVSVSMSDQDRLFLKGIPFVRAMFKQ